MNNIIEMKLIPFLEQYYNLQVTHIELELRLRIQHYLEAKRRLSTSNFALLVLSMILQ